MKNILIAVVISVLLSVSAIQYLQTQSASWKTFSSDEVLTASHMNDLETSALQSITDSLALAVLKTAFSDSANPLISDSLALALLKTAFADSLDDNIPQTLLDFPGLAVMDSTNAASDSVFVVALADTSYNSEYATYLHCYGNGSPSNETGIVAMSFIPPSANFDSLIFWFRSDVTVADSAKFDLRLKHDSTAILAQNDLVAASGNTWERKGYEISGLTIDSHTLWIKFYATTLHHVDISPFYIK